MNHTYTMTPKEAAAAVKAFRPKIVYPYHCRAAATPKRSRQRSRTKKGSRCAGGNGTKPEPQSQDLSPLKLLFR